MRYTVKQCDVDGEVSEKTVNVLHASTEDISTLPEGYVYKVPATEGEEKQRVLVRPDLVIASLVNQLGAERLARLEAEERMKKLEAQLKKETGVPIADLVEALKESGADVTVEELYGWMYAEGYIQEISWADRRLITEKAKGLIVVEETLTCKDDGETPALIVTPMVTEAGMKYFVELFQKGEMKLA